MRTRGPVVSLALTAMVALLVDPSPARADLLGRVLRTVDEPTTGGTPPMATAESLAAWAGDPTVVTLGTLIETTIGVTPALASARYDIAIAEAQIEQTRGRDNWLLQGQVQGSSASGGVFGGISIASSRQIQASFSVLKPTPWGGNVGVTATTQYTNTSLVGLPGNQQWFDTIGLTISQPLLRNRGQQFFEAREARQKVVRDVQVLARRLAAIQAVQQVVSGYWDLVLAERQIAITQQSLDLARERLRITTLGATGGKIARAEIPAVEQIIATREEELLNNELLIIDRSITLRRSTGMAIGTGQLGLRVESDLAIPETSPALADMIERAYQASPELGQLEKLADVDTIDIEVTENGLLPQLDAALQLGPTGQDTRFGQALQDMVTFDQFQIVGTLTFSHTIGNETVRGRAREQRLVREKRRVTAFDVRQQIAQSMARAVGQLELARRRVVLSRRAIDLARQNIQIETDRFALGKATNFDVLNRQEELRQSELRQAQAMVDYHKSMAVVMALTGDILPTYGITLE